MLRVLCNEISKAGLFRYRYMFRYKIMRCITGTLPICGITGTFGMFRGSPNRYIQGARCTTVPIHRAIQRYIERNIERNICKFRTSFLLSFCFSGLRSLGASMNSDTFSEQQGPAEQAVIKFNQKSYCSWTDARDAYRSVSRNATVTSVWNMVYAEADDADDDNKPFKLKCKNCNINCQLNNPSKWKRDHKCKKTAPRGKGSVSSLQGAQFKFVAGLLSTTVLKQ
jgi:hypothetical protein